MTLKPSYAPHETADQSSTPLESLLARIAQRKAVTGIIGLGYVGLPLADLFSSAGFSVLGYDIDSQKTEALMEGRSYIGHIADEKIQGMRQSGLFAATTDFSRIAEADTLSICVPTPLDEMKQPDLTAIRRTSEAIMPYLRPGQLIILESTTYPGTTSEVMVPILERSGLKVGEELFIAYSPEREDPANPHFTARTIPKVVGANDPNSRRAIEAFYGSVFDQIVPVSSCEAAELAKLLENIYRCVNIALVNELKLLCERMGINIWEVISASRTKPFGFQAFYPGPGLGGHCIPIDPFYLSWKARQFDFTTRFIDLAGEINTRMPYEVVERVTRTLNAQGRPTAGARVLVLGVAYKKNVDDIRESPAIKVIHLLRERGISVCYYDPHVPVFQSERHGELEAEALNELADATLAEVDSVLILTDHDAIDYERVVRLAKIVIDTRNATGMVQGELRRKIVLA